MDYPYLICSFSLFGASFAFYKLHKLWKKDILENNKRYKSEVNFKTFKNWTTIITFIVLGIIFFFKAMP